MTKIENPSCLTAAASRTGAAVGLSFKRQL
jgi:hypothetical protein